MAAEAQHPRAQLLLAEEEEEDEKPMDCDKTPVTIITGFLG